MSCIVYILFVCLFSWDSLVILYLTKYGALDQLSALCKAGGKGKGSFNSWSHLVILSWKEAKG